MTGAEWFLGAAILITFCIIAGWSVGGRRRERFVAPPPSWWVCPSCHSVNNSDDDLPLTCYRCGREADPASVERLETSPEFEWTQQLSTTRKGGWDHAVGWAADKAEIGDERDGAVTPGAGHDAIATDAQALPDAQSASDGSS